MTAADEFKRDAMKAMALSTVRPVFYAALMAVTLLAAYCSGKATAKADVKVAAAKSEIRRTVTLRETAVETVTVKLRAKAHMDTVVRIVTDTQVVIQETPSAKPDTVTVPAPIVTRIRTDSAVISALRILVVQDSGVIGAQSQYITLLEHQKQRCGRKCGFTLGILAGVLIHKVAK